MAKIIIIILTILIVGAVVYFPLTRFVSDQTSCKSPVTLTVWGTKEEEPIINYAAEGYKKICSSVTIKYVVQSVENYRSRVQSQIQAGAGPDIFMTRNNWVSEYIQNKTISSAPDTIITGPEFKQTFYPVAVQTLMYNGHIYALPREVDGLALYYNEDILKAQGISVPQYWDQFATAAEKMTVVDAKNNVVTAGAAIGTTGNIDYWPEILGSLFFQQPGGSIVDPSNSAGEEVVKFYTDFAHDKTKLVWDQNYSNSTVAFANGKVAFYFAPASELAEIHSLNPNLHFKTVPIPQLPSSSAVYSSFWAYSVSSKAKNQSEAWRFVNFLTSSVAQKALYAKEVQLYGYGSPYARIDLQKELINDPIMGAFVKQAPQYASWYLSSRFSDQGVNDDITASYKKAVDAILNGDDVTRTLTDTAKNIQTTLVKYGLGG